MLQFASDVELIFNNCIAYNGDDSEYSELAVGTKKAFEVFCKKHFEGEDPGEGGEGGGAKGRKSRKKRDSRSPSACKTPELTSESSSEEEESEDDR